MSTSWPLDTSLDDSFPNLFGFDVAMTDKWAIVSNLGKAWIFGRAASSSSSDWDKTPAVVIDQYGGGFGHAVAITDNFAIVGAYASRNAYIFARDDSAGWGSTAVTTFSGVSSRYGIDVAMTDNFAIVGADFGAAAFIYARDKDTGQWGTTPITSITQYSQVRGEGGFGWSVSITDHYAMVGSWGQKKAFIFPRDDKPGSTSYVQHGCAGSYMYDTRPPNVGTAASGISIFDTCRDACVQKGYSYFGLECPMATATHCQCYTNTRIQSLGQTQPLTKSCANTRAHCSNAPELSAGGVTYELGGWHVGSVYSVTRVTKESTPRFSSTAATIIDGYTSEAGFAAAVYISDNFAMVGTGRNDVALTVGAANKAFIFELDAASETWPKTAVTSITDYTSQNAFGFDVAINNKFAVVGAYFANTAFVFTRGENGKWSSTASSIILSGKGTFGWSVALANEYLMVGAGGWPTNRVNEAFIYRYGSGARSTATVGFETWYDVDGGKGDDDHGDMIHASQNDDIKWAYNADREPHAVFMFNSQYCRASMTSQPFEEVSYDPDRVFCSYIGSNAGDKCTSDTWDKPASTSITYVVETGERHLYKVQFISESNGDNDVRFGYENISPGRTAAPSVATTTTPTSSPSSMSSAHPLTSAPSSSPTLWSPPPPPGALSSVFGTSDSVTVLIAATLLAVLACIAFAACAFFYRRHSIKTKEGKSSESSSAEVETSKEDEDEDDDDDIDDYVHNPLNDTPLHQSADIEIADGDKDVSLHSIYEDKDADMQCEYPSEERVSKWDGSTLTFTSNPMLGEEVDTSVSAPAPPPAPPPAPLPRRSSVQKESGDEDSGGDAKVSPTRRNFAPTFEQNMSGNTSNRVRNQTSIVPGVKEGEGASKKGIEHQIYRKVLPAMVSVQLKKVGEF